MAFIIMEKISDILGRSLDRFNMTKKMEEQKVVCFWREVTGAEIDARTNCVGIKEGVLLVKVGNSIWAQQLSFLRYEFIKGLNQKMGTELVKDIRFKVDYRVAYKFEGAEEYGEGEPGEVTGPARKEKGGNEISQENLKRIEDMLKGVEDKELKEKLRSILVKEALKNWR